MIFDELNIVDEDQLNDIVYELYRILHKAQDGLYITRFADSNLKPLEENILNDILDKMNLRNHLADNEYIDFLFSKLEIFSNRLFDESSSIDEEPTFDVNDENDDEIILFEGMKNSIERIQHDPSINHHDLKPIEEAIESSITKTSELTNYTLFENDIEEMQRILLLNKAMEQAKRNVKAVTVDSRNYFDNFWSPPNDDYPNRNIEAANRDVTIERVFVMDDDVLRRRNFGDDKTKKFWEIIEKLREGGTNIELYVLPKSKLNGLDDTSLFLCDDIIASESGRSPNNSGGYFKRNDTKTYENLSERFSSLIKMAQKI